MDVDSCLQPGRGNFASCVRSDVPLSPPGRLQHHQPRHRQVANVVIIGHVVFYIYVKPINQVLGGWDDVQCKNLDKRRKFYHVTARLLSRTYLVRNAADTWFKILLSGREEYGFHNVKTRDRQEERFLRVPR